MCQNATTRVKEHLAAILPNQDFEVYFGRNACTGHTGWHYQQYGKPSVYVGRDLREVYAFCAKTLNGDKQERARIAREALRRRFKLMH